jgi:hypothetical protein
LRGDLEPIQGGAKRVRGIDIKTYIVSCHKTSCPITLSVFPSRLNHHYHLNSDHSLTGIKSKRRRRAEEEEEQ